MRGSFQSRNSPFSARHAAEKRTFASRKTRVTRAGGGAPALATDDAVRPEGDDPRVGIVDQWGGFYARDGFYYDRFGGHCEKDGYYDKDGSFKSRCGYRYDAKSTKRLETRRLKIHHPSLRENSARQYRFRSIDLRGHPGSHAARAVRAGRQENSCPARGCRSFRRTLVPAARARLDRVQPEKRRSRLR